MTAQKKTNRALITNTSEMEIKQRIQNSSLKGY